MTDLATSRALYNRGYLELRSDEVLAQLLDRGSLDDWRELYRLCVHDPDLRRRINLLTQRAPIGSPHLWRAALISLGEPIDWDAPVVRDADLGT